MALKLRRADERVVIQYPTRAASFKRLLGGALPPCPRAATCPDFVGITPHPDRRDSYRIGEACAVDLKSHSERRNDNRVPFFPIEADVVRTPQLPDGRANPDSFARAKARIVPRSPVCAWRWRACRTRANTPLWRSCSMRCANSFQIASSKRSAGTSRSGLAGQVIPCRRSDRAPAHL